MDQMTTPEAYQELMVWMSMEMLGSVDVIWWDFG
jgi:hypothetical protein